MTQSPGSRSGFILHPSSFILFGVGFLETPILNPPYDFSLCIVHPADLTSDNQANTVAFDGRGRLIDERRSRRRMFCKRLDGNFTCRYGNTVGWQGDWKINWSADNLALHVAV